jgi:hypothetical protein
MKSRTFAILVLSGVLGAALPLVTADAAAPPAEPPATAPATPAKTPAPKPPAAKPPAAKSGDLVGTWTGSVVEVGRSKGFPIIVSLKGKTGQTTYPDQHCTGKLERSGVTGSYSFFVETITEGKFDPATKTGCVDGSLTLIRSGTDLVLGWFAANSDKPVVAFATLTPQAK